MDEETKTAETLLAVVFEAGGSLFAIDSSRVEEIARLPRITAVRGAEEQVLGIANLRGRIITVLDAAMLLGFGPTPLGEEARILVANQVGESIGLVVERLRDVVEVEQEGLHLISCEGASPRAELYLGAFEEGGRTVALLAPDRILEA